MALRARPQLAAYSGLPLSDILQSGLGSPLFFGLLRVGGLGLALSTIALPFPRP